MKILVANLGSTSFKYRLFDMADERVLARGGVERIGSPQSRCFVEAGGVREETTVEAQRPRCGGAAVSATAGRPEAALPGKPVGAGGHRLQGRPRSRRLPACSASMTGCCPRWRRMPTWPRPTTRPMSRPCGCCRANCRRSRWSPRSRRGFTKPSRRRSASTPCRWNGRRSTASSAGAFTAPATATSPGARPSCSTNRTRRSSRATSAAAVPCARLKRAYRLQAAWA